jgi:hypothetical protein
MGGARRRSVVGRCCTRDNARLCCAFIHEVAMRRHAGSVGVLQPEVPCYCLRQHCREMPRQAVEHLVTCRLIIVMSNTHNVLTAGTAGCCGAGEGFAWNTAHLSTTSKAAAPRQRQRPVAQRPGGKELWPSWFEVVQIPDLAVNHAVSLLEAIQGLSGSCSISKLAVQLAFGQALRLTWTKPAT